LRLDKPAFGFGPRDENTSSPDNCSTDIVLVGSTTAVARPATSIDELSAYQVKASRVEVIPRLKLELDRARLFIAQNEIKRAPHPIRSGSVVSTFVSKDVRLRKLSYKSASDFGPHDENYSLPGNYSVDTMSVGSTTAHRATTIDESIASQTKASRFEAMKRLKREVDLAHDFVAQNEIKRAPRPIPPGSDSTSFL
jgi:hypothetical protein